MTGEPLRGLEFALDKAWADLGDYECSFHRIMQHWRKVLPPGVMIEVRYEDIVEDVEASSRRLMDFLGLEWEEAQMSFYKQGRSVFTASKWQARQPIYKTSTEKWRQYEKHLGPLLHLPTLAGY